MDEWEQCVRQATITLPYFHYKVPVLNVGEGMRYIPMIALCEMLGLRANTHISRWRKLHLWANARKLPLSTTSGKRIVWCLHLGALPFWWACFTWSLVSSVRLEQLRQTTDTWLEVIAHAHQQMVDRYRSLRRDLFVFLLAYSDVEDMLRQWSFRLSLALDVAASRQLEFLISQGSMIIDHATSHSRKMLHEQAMTTIANVSTLNANGKLTEMGTLPFFPVVPHKDCEQFYASMSQLTQWHKGMITLIDKLILLQGGDQSEEA